MATLDQDGRYYLLGDEDAGVGLHCMDCDTGWIPVIYYGDTHPNPAVPVTDSIDEFVSARGRHDMQHPADVRAVFPSSNVTVRNGKEG